MTAKWHVYMTFDGRISMAGLSGTGCMAGRGAAARGDRRAGKNPGCRPACLMEARPGVPAPLHPPNQQAPSAAAWQRRSRTAC